MLASVVSQSRQYLAQIIVGVVPNGRVCGGMCFAESRGGSN